MSAKYFLFKVQPFESLWQEYTISKKMISCKTYGMYKPTSTTFKCAVLNYASYSEWKIQHFVFVLCLHRITNWMLCIFVGGCNFVKIIRRMYINHNVKQHLKWQEKRSPILACVRRKIIFVILGQIEILGMLFSLPGNYVLRINRIIEMTIS